MSSSLTDDELLRLADDILRSGLEPRVEVRMRIVHGFEGGGRVLVVEVPRSFRAPHMVAGGRAKFFSRGNGGKEALDVEQLRAAFGASDTLAERIREFRMERLARIVADDNPVRLCYRRGRVVLHLVPLSAFSTPLAHMSLIERAAKSQRVRPLYDEGGGGYGHHFNLDGFCFHDEIVRDSGASGYVQFFRQGMIEAVDSVVLQLQHENGAGKLLADQVERYVQHGLRRYGDILRDELGVEGPAAVMLSLVNVLGFVLDLKPWRLAQQRPIDRAQVVLPDVIVEDLADAAAPSTLKPIFDALWQTAGARRSPNFDDDGRWTEPPP